MRFGFYSCCCVVLLLGARVARADGWGWIPEIRALEAERAALRMKLAGLPAAPPVQLTQRLGWHSEYGKSETKTEWVELDLGQAQRVDAVVLIPPPPNGAAVGAGYGFPRRFYVELLGDRSALPLLEHVVLLDGPTRVHTTTWAEFLSMSNSVSTSAAAERAAALTPDDLCDILFTSGTTGLPKGAMLTHGASVRAYWSWSNVVGLTKGDRYLIINPFFHGFGLKSGILASILMGATILPHPVFDVPSVMRRVEEERITMLPGPPTVYMTMLDHPELKNFDLSSLRLSVTGAATVPVEMIHRMRSEMTFKTIVTGYGLTEATGIATMCRHTDDPEIIANTAGRAIPDVEVIVADDNRQPVASGEPGEVLIRGYNIMKGFIGNPEATAEAIDDEGWLHTGDIGVMDEAGNLRITDRMKDMFIVGGFNAYPAEIENILITHPGISQVAVLGIPDTRMGEIGVAFVIAKPEVTLTPDDIVAWSRESMANYKVPRHVIVVEEFPLNASGKVLKYVLRETAIENAS